MRATAGVHFRRNNFLGVRSFVVGENIAITHPRALVLYNFMAPFLAWRAMEARRAP